MKNKWPALGIAAGLLITSACTSGTTPSGSTTSQNGGGNPLATTDVLLYNGTGVSTSDWQTTESLIQSQGWSYELINSTELNAMTAEEIASFALIVVPGGKGGTITSYLTQEARLNLRQAVQDQGVGYVGFCAGAWIAVGPEAESSAVAGYGLAIAPGEVLSTYWPGGNTGLTADIVPVTLENGSLRNLVWWGGPSTPEWSDPSNGSGVLGRYETGEPALSQTYAGKGLVVISGPHPEAPQSWWLSSGSDPDGLDWDLAISMMNAAKAGTWLRL